MKRRRKNTPAAPQSSFKKTLLVVRFVLEQKHVVKKTLRWLGRVMRALLRILSIDHLSFRARGGFDDPSLTGALYGYYQGLIYGLDLKDSRRITLDFEPQFDHRDSFECAGSLSVRTTLGRLVWPVFIALATFPYVTALMLWWRIRTLKKRLAPAPAGNDATNAPDESGQPR